MAFHFNLTGRIAIARETTRTASPHREPALLKS
jgi:hypothetical protein